MIRLDNVNKYYNKKKSNEIHVINHTSIELGNKGLVTFLGPSGCGKTTLLNVIGGLDKVNSGEIYIDQDKITCRSDNKKDEIRNANVGYIFQNYNLIEDATVFENVALVLRMMGMKDKQEIQRRVMYILQRVGIDRYKNRPVKMLSGGERQRVGIARAIVKNPKIIIADEPTGNLDSKNTIEIMNIIKAISREKLVILVTHERELAEFYASRVVEIIDGKIVSDRENAHDEELDYRIENKIYLKDMPVQKELNDGGVHIKYFSDEEEDFAVRVVIKNHHLYIEMPEHLNMGSAAVELVNDHYRKMSKDIYEDYEFDYDQIIDHDFKPRYTSIYNPISLIVNGYRKVISYSAIKKILMAGFVFASMFVLYAMSSVAGVTNITDDEFVTVNQNYLTVSSGVVTPETYEKYSQMEGIDYVLPGDSNVSFTLPLDDYYQTVGAYTIMRGSLAATDLADEATLVAGRGAEAKDELLIDKMIIDTMQKSEWEAPKQVGLIEYEDFVGRTVNLKGLAPFTITGITDQGSPCIYADKNMFMSILQCQTGEGDMDDMEMMEASDDGDDSIVDYNLVKDNGELTIKYGSEPDEINEALVSLERQYEVAIGSKLDTKVNGENLIVCGFYESKRQQMGTIYVDAKTAENHFLSKQKHLTLSPEDKKATYEALSGGNIKVTDTYETAKKQYMKKIKRQILATVCVAIVILLISLIEMYLMLRASFLSRIKEVGVLRAIGLKKRDIYKMFLGEIIVLTTLTALPGMLLMAYMISEIIKIPYAGDSLMINPGIVILSFGVVFLFNILAGLMPVVGTVRKAPAAILARNDVN